MILPFPQNIPEEIVFFHGTSLQNLEKILQGGMNPFSSFSVVFDKFQAQMWEIYGTAINRQTHFSEAHDESLDLEGAFSLAAEYARTRGVWDYFRELFPSADLFDLDNERGETHSNILNPNGSIRDDWMKELVALFPKEAEFAEISIKHIRNGIQQKGVVLGFGIDLIDEYGSNKIDYLSQFHIQYPTGVETSISRNRIKVIYSGVQSSSVVEEKQGSLF